MRTNDYSESEAQGLVGKRFRYVAKNSIVPRGAQGQAVAIRKNERGGYNILVEWQVNPAFIMQEPIHAEYSLGEVAQQLEKK